ncbi:hypothetical protein [Bradyrhizobium sp.]|uniref:hypothetical protein n=1 Tax=Bradyrhizobium sp. TaxID=376 RepID=UPI00260E7FD8|nr:hypothetical protein [Bradyrhizobium sp.]
MGKWLLIVCLLTGGFIETASAGSMMLLGAGSSSPSLPRFEGKDLREILKEVPCDKITKDGRDFKIAAILVVDHGKEQETLTQPVISQEDQIREIEKHCPEGH